MCLFSTRLFGTMGTDMNRYVEMLSWKQRSLQQDRPQQQQRRRQPSSEPISADSAVVKESGYVNNDTNDNNDSYHGIIIALILFANYSILSMLLFAGIDGPEMEEYGFCGQLGVLMYLTSISWMLFFINLCFIISTISKTKAYYLHRYWTIRLSYS